VPDVGAAQRGWFYKEVAGVVIKVVIIKGGIKFILLPFFLQ
jgi:hypothetical protein